MPNETLIAEHDDTINYLKLALELAEIKRQMVKLHNLNRITEPDNGEIFVLSYLTNRAKPVCPKDISNAMNISSARIARLLNQLEQKSFIKRAADPENGRQTLIHLLPEGNEQHQKNIENFNQRTMKFLKALGAKDAMEYIRLQKKILEIYTK